MNEDCELNDTKPPWPHFFLSNGFPCNASRSLIADGETETRLALWPFFLLDVSEDVQRDRQAPVIALLEAVKETKQWETRQQALDERKERKDGHCRHCHSNDNEMQRREPILFPTVILQYINVQYFPVICEGDVTNM